MIVIDEPQRFGRAARLVVNLFPLITFVPLVLAILVFSAALVLNSPELGVAAVVLSLATFPFFFIALPFLAANSYIRSLVPERPGVVVQIEYTPSLTSGLDHALEDADDIGRITVDSEAVTFLGDRSRFVLGPEDIESIERVSAGWRVLWLTGPKVRLTLKPDSAGRQALTIGVRDGYLLWSQRRAANGLLAELGRLFRATA